MRYLMIDRVLRLEKDRSIRAIKSVSQAEDYFRDHFPGNPVMPGALMIEAAAQAGTALLEVSSDYTRKAILIMVHDAKFRSVVRPGQTLILDLTITDRNQHSVTVDCEITSSIPGEEAKRTATMVLSFSLPDASEFYPEYMRSHVRAMYESWLDNTAVL